MMVIAVVLRRCAVTSSRTTRISGSRSMAAVTACGRTCRGPRRARDRREPRSGARSPSAANRRGASLPSAARARCSRVSDFSELEQTSSAKFAVWCAGVERTGRISYSSTATPRRAHCQAASEPASPAPMMRMGLGMRARSKGWKYYMGGSSENRWSGHTPGPPRSAVVNDATFGS